ncbi:hypothetical protein BDW22DRAFT_685732 [Trametopsis cervina]|nr:hypothetical protein BDW22DRAFT_685732 [Trametopsis cervina]
MATRHPVSKAAHERQAYRSVEALRPHLFYNQPRRSYPRRRLSHIPSPLSFDMESPAQHSPLSSPQLPVIDDGASIRAQLQAEQKLWLEDRVKELASQLHKAEESAAAHLATKDEHLATKDELIGTLKGQVERERKLAEEATERARRAEEKLERLLGAR